MTTNTQAPISDIPNVSFNLGSTPFEQEMVLITKQEYIKLTTQINYWRSQHSKAKEKINKLEQQIHYKDGQIKDLQKRLFGKQSEKQSSPKSKKNNTSNSSNRSRGQQKNSVGLIDLIYPSLMNVMTYPKIRNNALNVVYPIFLRE